MRDDRLRFESVVKSYGRTRALDVDLALAPGSYVALTGHNGAGKTTLLRLAAGLATPTRGRVVLAGVDLREAGPGLRRLIGFASHDTMLYRRLTGRENLMLHARLFRLPDPVAAIDEAAGLLDLEAALERPVEALSHGTRQRLSLCRALLHAPRVLLLDEPYTGLDAASADRLQALLEGLHSAGTTVVLSTHDPQRASHGPTRVLTLRSGRVLRDDRPAREPLGQVAWA
jgi:ABC-2 type transport system ATP-binding protein